MRSAFTASVLLLCAACAAPPSGPHFVTLKADYGCGAAEGLGCGLAIAPVLERIDGLDGVAESRASWDGQWFRIEVRPGADPDAVAAAAAAVLEGDATCVAKSRGEAAAGEPDRWYSAAETVALSRHEAGVIASGLSATVESEVALAPDDARRLQDVLREELQKAFEQAHADGGGVHRLWERLPESWPRFEARLAEFLTPAQAGQVAQIVEREIGA